MNNWGELNRYRRRFVTALIATLLMMTVLPMPAIAAEEDEPRVLRVAFYQIQGMTRPGRMEHAMVWWWTILTKLQNIRTGNMSTST